jgi:BDI_1685-like, C-terminal domain
MNWAAPDIYRSNWPPSGMKNLDEPFQMAIQYSTGANKNNWKFYYGTWLAGRGNSEEAIKILSQTSTGLAKVLLARLLKLKGDLRGAKKAFDAIEEKWLQLHPQVIVERDKVLRALGSSFLTERESWLTKIEALKDEWVIERRIQLLIDKGEYVKAKELLLSTPFQKVHQTYTRTGLWMQICEKLNINCDPIPAQLGEDRLARFGAYREYE